MTKSKTDNNMVEIRLPRPANGEEPFIFAGVNGIQYQIPKGKASLVPDFIAAEIERSLEAQEEYDRTIRSLSEQSEK